MNLIKLLKAGIALGFIAQFAVITLGLTVLQILLLVPVVGTAIVGAVDAVYLVLGIAALPIFLIITLKMLGWIDEGFGEIGFNLHIRKTFIKFRNSITKHLPKLAKEFVNYLT